MRCISNKYTGKPRVYTNIDKDIKRIEASTYPGLRSD